MSRVRSGGKICSLIGFCQRSVFAQLLHFKRANARRQSILIA